MNGLDESVGVIILKSFNESYCEATRWFQVIVVKVNYGIAVYHLSAGMIYLFIEPPRLGFCYVFCQVLLNLPFQSRNSLNSEVSLVGALSFISDVIKAFDKLAQLFHHFLFVLNGNGRSVVDHDRIRDREDNQQFCGSEDLRTTLMQTL